MGRPLSGHSLPRRDLPGLHRPALLRNLLLRPLLLLVRVVTDLPAQRPPWRRPLWMPRRLALSQLVSRRVLHPRLVRLLPLGRRRPVRLVPVLPVVPHELALLHSLRPRLRTLGLWPF